MILLSENKAGVGDAYGPIQSWQVWFQTPYGLFDSLEAAKSRLGDLDPDAVIIPVPVAVTERGYEISCRA